MKIDTKLTKVSRNVKKQKGFINPGIYKGSTMIFETFEDYINDIKNDDDRSTLYGINKNPSVKQLEIAISNLYNLLSYSFANRINQLILQLHIDLAELLEDPL